MAVLLPFPPFFRQLYEHVRVPRLTNLTQCLKTNLNFFRSAPISNLNTPRHIFQKNLRKISKKFFTNLIYSVIEIEIKLVSK